MRHGRCTFILLLLASFALTGCGGSDTGPSVENNPPPAPDDDVTYDGPAPRTSDVVSFKLNLWDNLVSSSRCGACHGTGGQSPAFVRDDNINSAYNQANSIVSLRSPATSRMVEKVARGHNCWLDSDQACADLITTWIGNWAGQSLNAEASEVNFTAPPIKDPGTTRSFPESPALFQSSTLYSLAQSFCDECHRPGVATPITPYFASDDVDEAYQAVRNVVNLNDPGQSRLVQRLGEDFHNCWTSCDDDADTMTDAIAELADQIPLTPPDSDLVLSKALNLEDGILANTGGRVEPNVIAKYEFRTGDGGTAFDTSGVEPALDLTLHDVGWVGGWGLSFSGGDSRAVGSTAASAKLHDLITGSGEFTLEAWVVPATPGQQDANIVSYSANDDERNVTLRQQQSRYSFALRQDGADANGMPVLESDDESLQATLQHVVVTYDAMNGRRIFINGQDTGVSDPVTPSLLNSWVDNHALILGNETSRNSPWSGTLRFLAIHNRALTPAQVARNFDAGVGERFYLLFAIGDLIDLPDSYIGFQASRFDNYSYLFAEPFFINLDEEVTPPSIDLEGMRLGINGSEVSAGQAWSRLDVTIGGSDYDPAGQRISRLGTVIGLERGQSQDEFFLTFERLGDHTDMRTEPTPAPDSLEPVAEQPRVGLRTFAEINAGMSTLTGVPHTRNAVANTYSRIRQQLPSSENLGAFVTSHQVGVAQLAIEYCDSLVEAEIAGDPQVPVFFSGLDYSRNANAISDAEWQTLVIEPLVARMVTTGDAPGEDSQPLPADVEAELNNLLLSVDDIKPVDSPDGVPDGLARCGGSCPAEQTAVATKAACAATLGSAALLLQ